MNLSKHLTRDEFEFSPTAVKFGIDNSMNEAQLKAASLLAEKVFEPIRSFRGGPIKINSGFRSAALNKRIGGASGSQHSKGEALDLPLTPEEFHFIRETLEFDQLIWEFGNDKAPAWVHVSFSATKNRKQVLKAVKVGGVTKYLNY
jgi:D-alanyl-D-alanine dipeptidase